LDITVTEGNLHIDGYPAARRFVKLSAHPFGQKIADLRLHQSDLMFCAQAMQQYGLHLKQPMPNDCQQPSNLMDIKIYEIAILTKFIGCFKKSKGRKRLVKEDVFAGDVNAMTSFRYFESLRDKHIVHDENPLQDVVVGVVLGENNEVIDIISLGKKMQHDISGYLNEAQNLYNLIDHTLKYVTGEIDKNLKSCFEWLRKMQSEQLSKMHDVKMDWVDTSQAIDQTRKYE
jgi:hypothetical protein